MLLLTLQSLSLDIATWRSLCFYKLPSPNAHIQMHSHKHRHFSKEQNNMCLSSSGVGFFWDTGVKRIWFRSHWFNYRELFFWLILLLTHQYIAVHWSNALTFCSEEYRIWQPNDIILTVVLDLNGEQRLSLSVGHRHLIKASSSWGCHVVNSDDANGDVEFVSLLSTRPRQRDAVIVSLWRADVRCWRSQKGEREAVGNGVRSDVKVDGHRLAQEVDRWNRCVAAPRFACFRQ